MLFHHSPSSHFRFGLNREFLNIFKDLEEFFSCKITPRPALQIQNCTINTSTTDGMNIRERESPWPTKVGQVKWCSCSRVIMCSECWLMVDGLAHCITTKQNCTLTLKTKSSKIPFCWKYSCKVIWNIKDRFDSRRGRRMSANKKFNIFQHQLLYLSINSI